MALTFKTKTVLLTASLLLTACSNGTSPNMATEPVDDPVMGGDETGSENGLPDFSVVDFTVSDAFDSNFVAIATIANGGTAAHTVEDGWILVSQESNFTENYQEVPVRFNSIDGAIDDSIQPGEVRQFRLVSTFLNDDVYLRLHKNGDHYMRLWINPDLGARFMNPEPQLMESHTIQELDYTNNISPEVPFDNGQSLHTECVPDQYEENDSIEQATLIALDTVYEFIGCDDLTEVMAIELSEGERYELRRIDRSTSIGFWKITIFDPDGNYLVRNSISNADIFDATMSGSYIIVATNRSADLEGNISLEVVQR